MLEEASSRHIVSNHINNNTSFVENGHSHNKAANKQQSSKCASNSKTSALRAGNKTGYSSAATTTRSGSKSSRKNSTNQSSANQNKLAIEQQADNQQQLHFNYSQSSMPQQQPTNAVNTLMFSTFVTFEGNKIKSKSIFN